MTPAGLRWPGAGWLPALRLGRGAWLMLVAAALMAVTVLVFRDLPRYRLPGRPLLTDPAFQDGLAEWQQHGLVRPDRAVPGRVVLQNREPTESAWLERVFELPPERNFLWLSASAQARAIKPGPQPTARGRIVLAQIDALGRLQWQRPHALAELDGTSSPQSFNAVFAVPSTIPQVMLGLHLRQATGELMVEGLRLELVSERALFRLAATSVVAAWCLLAALTLHRLRRSLEPFELQLWFGGACGMLGGALMLPASWRQVVLEDLGRGLALPGHIVGPLALALVFALLAGLVRLGRPEDRLWLQLTGWLLTATAAEVALLTIDHLPQPGRWLFAVAGSLAGLTAIAISRRLMPWLEPSARRPRRRRK